jgi:hypothetical protein
MSGLAAGAGAHPDRLNNFCCGWIAMLPRRVYLHHVTTTCETVLDNRFLEGILDTTDAWIRVVR